MLNSRPVGKEAKLELGDYLVGDGVNDIDVVVDDTFKDEGGAA